MSRPVRKEPRTITVGGERLTVREWAERIGIPANVISNRLNRGWTLERAVGVPVQPRRDA